jgi:1-acyl-sn-glycerol-3-phosphate acyltransferase
MIRDARHPLWTPLLHRYVTWKLKRAFRGVWRLGELPATDEPLILYANHIGFWDGFVVHALTHQARRHGYAVMEQHNLERYRFLRRLGALSIRRGDRGSALETLRYCATVLRRPRASLLLFPQGRLGAPLKLERGVEVLARMSKARAVPIALRYAFFEHEHPDVLVAAGEPHVVTGIEECEQHLRAQLDRVAAVEQPTSLTPLLAGRRSVAERWDRARGLTLKEQS